jgi:hypothetical protein
MKKRNYQVVVIAIIMLVLTSEIILCQQIFKTKNECCDYWDFYLLRDQSKLKLFMQYQGDSIFIRDDDDSVMCGIRCLLKYEGNRKKMKMSLAKFNPECSSIYSGEKHKNTAEVAALFAIRNMFMKEHELYTMILLDDKENANSKESIKKAYRYYREWFAEVEKVGLTKAREMNWYPLKGKDVHWDTGSGCN